MFWIGLVLVTCVSEVALSHIQGEKWSNYVQTWEIKWSTSVKKNKLENKREKEITNCGVIPGIKVYKNQSKNRQVLKSP